MNIINKLLIDSQNTRPFQGIWYTVAKFLSARGHGMSALKQAWDDYVNAIKNFSDQHDQFWQPWVHSNEKSSEKPQFIAYKHKLKDQNLSTQFQRETQNAENIFFSALTKTLTTLVNRKYPILNEDAKEDRISQGKEKFLKKLNSSENANQVPKWLNNKYLPFLLKEQSSELEDAVQALLEVPEEIKTQWKNFVSNQITVNCSLTDLVVLNNKKFQWRETISNENKPYKTRFNQYLKSICYTKIQGESRDSPLPGNDDGKIGNRINTIHSPDKDKGIKATEDNIRLFRQLLNQSTCIPKEKYTHGYFLTQVLNLNEQVARKWIEQTFSQKAMQKDLLKLYIWNETFFHCFREDIPHPFIQKQAPALLHKHNLTADKQWQKLLVQWRTQYEDPDTPFVKELKQMNPQHQEEKEEEKENKKKTRKNTVWEASTEYLRLLAQFRWREILYESYKLNQKGNNPIEWEEWQRKMRNLPALRQLIVTTTNPTLIPLLKEIRELVNKAGLQNSIPRCMSPVLFRDNDEMDLTFLDQLLKHQFGIHLLPFLPPMEEVQHQEPAFDLSILKDRVKNQILPQKNDGLRLDMAWHLYYSFLTQDLHEKKQTEPIHLEEFDGYMAISFQASRDHFHLEEIQFTQEGTTP